MSLSGEYIGLSFFLGVSSRSTICLIYILQVVTILAIAGTAMQFNYSCLVQKHYIMLDFSHHLLFLSVETDPCPPLKFEKAFPWMGLLKELLLKRSYWLSVLLFSTSNTSLLL